MAKKKRTTGAAKAARKKSNRTTGRKTVAPRKAKPKPELPPFTGYDPELMKFIKQLTKNNNRDWFVKNKTRYEGLMLWPSLSLIQDLQNPLEKITPHFTAIPKRMGGSLMRIYRDTRFSKNKDPYKLNIGIHLRHEVGKDVHAPGFYIHVAANEIFVGAGVWRPDGPALTQIRQFIDEHTAAWKRAKSGKFKKQFEIHGNSLKRPPKGYDAGHPMIDDLKMKDHFGLSPLKDSDLYDAKLINKVVDKIKASKPFVRALCDALHLPC